MDETDRFTVLFQRHYPQVLAYALRRVDESTAHDVVAQTLLAAWRHVDRLPDEPLPWLYRAAAHCIANELRSRRRRGQLADRIVSHQAADDTRWPDHADGVVEAQRLRTALGHLNQTDREALFLIAWEGLDHRAAAYAMGCSVTAFRVRLHRARRRLSRLLDNPERLLDPVTVEDF